MGLSLFIFPLISTRRLDNYHLLKIIVVCVVGVNYCLKFNHHEIKNSFLSFFIDCYLRIPQIEFK